MDESRKLDRTWLCTVVFSDIVDYSSQSVEVQIRWKNFFNEVLTEALKPVPVDDRVVLDTGDGAAICFLGDPETALSSTLSLRAAFVAAAAAGPSNPAVRLGINLGPVKLVRDINANLNALGDGINVAQRIMSFAGQNQVLVSRSFFEVVSRLSDDYNRLFRYDGVRQDKHVREHTVYELAPTGSEIGSLPIAVASAAALEPGPSSPVVPKQPERTPSRGIWLGSAAGAALLILIAVYALRPKPQPAAAPVQQSALPAAVSSPPTETPAQPPAQVVKAPPAVATPSASATIPSLPTEKATRPSSVASNATPSISGRWQADVKYSWGPTYTEIFDFKAEDHEVSGTASYVRGRRAIFDGKLDGNKLTFTTKSQTALGDKTYEEKHAYTGRVFGDTIEFTLQTDSGYDSRPPEMFIAKRVPTDSAPQ